GWQRGPLSPVDAAAILKQSKCRAVGQRRFLLFSLFERNVIGRGWESFRRREAAQGKSRFVGHSEHWCCNQRRLSIRFAKEGRRRGSPQSHRRPQPFENHNRPTFFIRK